MKTVYLVRHSAPFVEIDNYSDYNNSPWVDCNRNMILSAKGEDKARALCNLKELENLDEIYSSDSYRAIGTAKYVAEMNNLKIRLDDRINERNLGVEKINDLPENFTIDSFNNKNLKMVSGESLSEVDKRFQKFIDELLNKDFNSVALFIHGIMLMSYLQEHSKFEFDGNNMSITYNDRVVFDDRMKNPLVFKLVFDTENNLVDIDYIAID